jgi:hypothetical protein
MLYHATALCSWAMAIVALYAPLLACAGEFGTHGEESAILSTVRTYLMAVYARDYAEAYRWLSAADRRLKSQADYEQDNEPFTGAMLVLTKRLAQEIVVRQPTVGRDGQRATVQAMLSLPNGNAEEISALLFSDSGFAGAPTHELGDRLAKLEALIASDKLPRVEVQETWTLRQDPEGWRIFADWASGVRLQFVTHVPNGLPVTAAFDRAAVLTPRGEAVQLRLMVRNHGQEPVRLKVVHRVEPAAFEQRLDLVQCGYLFARDIAAGEADQAPVIYFVDGDLPPDVSTLRVTLEFVMLE